MKKLIFLLSAFNIASLSIFSADTPQKKIEFNLELKTALTKLHSSKKINSLNNADLTKEQKLRQLQDYNEALTQLEASVDELKKIQANIDLARIIVSCQVPSLAFPLLKYSLRYCNAARVQKLQYSLTSLLQEETQTPDLAEVDDSIERDTLVATQKIYKILTNIALWQHKFPFLAQSVDGNSTDFLRTMKVGCQLNYQRFNEEISLAEKQLAENQKEGKTKIGNSGLLISMIDTHKKSLKNLLSQCCRALPHFKKKFGAQIQEVEDELEKFSILEKNIRQIIRVELEILEKYAKRFGPLLQKNEQLLHAESTYDLSQLQDLTLGAQLFQTLPNEARRIEKQIKKRMQHVNNQKTESTLKFLAKVIPELDQQAQALLAKQTAIKEKLSHSCQLCKKNCIGLKDSSHCPQCNLAYCSIDHQRAHFDPERTPFPRAHMYQCPSIVHYVTDQCNFCGKKESDSTSRLRACGRCLKSKYCSTECQKVHWTLHKFACSSGTEIKNGLLEVLPQALFDKDIAEYFPDNMILKIGYINSPLFFIGTEKYLLTAINFVCSNRLSDLESAELTGSSHENALVPTRICVPFLIKDQGRSIDHIDIEEVEGWTPMQDRTTKKTYMCHAGKPQFELLNIVFDVKNIRVKKCA